jgi:hypothetical protein
MNPRAVKNFLTSKFGLFVVFVAVLFGGVWLCGRNQAEQRQAARVAAAAKKTELGKVKVPLNEGLESGLPQQTGAVRDPAAQPVNEVGDGRIVPFRAPTPQPAAPVAAKKSEPVRQPRKIRYQPLLAAYDPVPPAPKTAPAAPKRFIPYGTLLKCKLVNTVDSANLETPIIAVLLEDVWQNGERVVPANTLVHGTASAGRIRDRISASGTWRFVWQDGRELAFTGIALDREYDHEIDGYGITDGSAGLRGRVLTTDDLQDLKVLASAALSGFARGTQDRTQTALGTSITGSVSNGVREGVGEVFDTYAQRTLREVEQNGYFVRVAAGKEFYVYVVGTVTPDKAKIAGAPVEKRDEISDPSVSPAEVRPESDSKTKG